MTETANAPVSQRVLVTRAARGIGLAIARAFVADGARVMVCDKDVAASAELANSDPGLAAVQADVADTETVSALFAAVQSQLNGLDVQVNNAAVTGPFGPVDENDPAAWSHAISVNLMGQLHCAHFGVPLLKAAGGGSLVNMSSVAGRLGYPLRSSYAASKWGIIGLTQTQAMELGQFGIRANAILPGDRGHREALRSVGGTGAAPRSVGGRDERAVPEHHLAGGEGQRG